jgi:DNA polymerase-3 subunit alpha
MDFAPAPGDRRAIRYGLSAVRATSAAASWRASWTPGIRGAFTSFADFCRRVEPTSLTKRVLESLIFAGASSAWEYTRGGMLQQVGEQRLRAGVSALILAERKAEAAGQFSLFGGEEGVVEIDESGVGRRGARQATPAPRREKEMLGQFVTDHPLLGVEDQPGAVDMSDHRPREP